MYYILTSHVLYINVTCRHMYYILTSHVLNINVVYVIWSIFTPRGSYSPRHRMQATLHASWGYMKKFLILSHLGMRVRERVRGYDEGTRI